MTSTETTTTPVPRDQELEPELSVVIPCLNEAKTLGIVIGKALDSFERIGIAGEAPFLGVLGLRRR